MSSSSNTTATVSRTEPVYPRETDYWLDPSTGEVWRYDASRKWVHVKDFSSGNISWLRADPDKRELVDKKNGLKYFIMGGDLFVRTPFGLVCECDGIPAYVDYARVEKGQEVEKWKEEADPADWADWTSNRWEKWLMVDPCRWLAVTKPNGTRSAYRWGASGSLRVYAPIHDGWVEATKVSLESGDQLERMRTEGLYTEAIAAAMKWALAEKIKETKETKDQEQDMSNDSDTGTSYTYPASSAPSLDDSGSSGNRYYSPEEMAKLIDERLAKLHPPKPKPSRLAPLVKGAASLLWRGTKATTLGAGKVGIYFGDSVLRHFLASSAGVVAGYYYGEEILSFVLSQLGALV